MEDPSYIQHQAKTQLYKVLVDEAAESLKKKYKEMFKPTSGCRQPHVNIDVLRDGLFSVNAVQEGRFQTSQQLLQQLQKINLQLSVLCHDNTKSRMLYPGEVKALEKAKKYNFYLGMKKDWLTDNAYWQ